MLGLDDIQQRFASAMTTGNGSLIVAELRGGRDPSARLAIHLRHYSTSLATALVDKYPALTWLVGPYVMRDAAIAYARAHPPLAPCIAEYGREFPAFLSRHACAVELPYLQSFGELEWAIAQASIAIDEQPLSWTEIANLNPECIVDATLALQPGAYYVASAWRIDELLNAYLNDDPPERFILIEAPTLLEVQGARGAFRLTRLEAATYAFRAAIAASRTIGDAANAALTIEPTFDAGHELHAIVDLGLATHYSLSEREVLS